MNFFKGFGLGVSEYFKAIGFIFEKGLWHYLFYPLLLWIITFILSTYAIFQLSEMAGEWVLDQIGGEVKTDDADWLKWIKLNIVPYLGFVVGWVFKLLWWYISGTFTKYTTLMILSPVIALLSESTEEKINGKDFPFSFPQLLKDMVRGVLINFRNMFLEYFFILISFILCLFFPPLAFFTVPFLLVIGWYYIGFSMLDYSCERYKMGVIASTRFVRKNSGLAIGIGFAYSIILWIPLIGLAFSPVLATVGSTRAFLKLQEDTKK